ALMERVGGMSAEQAQRLAQKGRRLALSLEERLGGPQGAILLMPPHPRPAPPHRAPYLRPFDFAFTAAFNVMRLPATAVPMGLGTRGLPLAVQVAAARGGDHLTIAAALLLEEEFGGWRLPPRLEEARAE
ncbi:MAG TPA: hypothetical protein VF832_07270, partial [Longimicrobiales bacterium]